MTQYRLVQDDPQRFATAFNFLASSKNAKCDDVKLEASFTVLRGLPIASVELAAKILAKEANAFMPDDGSWYEVADTLAAESLLKDANNLRQITPGHDLEREAIEATKRARDRFVKEYETICGKVLPSNHVWKTEITSVRTSHCSQCSDVGWKGFHCTAANQCGSCRDKRRHIYDHDYVDRCACFDSNPLLVAARAESHLKARARSNRR